MAAAEYPVLIESPGIARSTKPRQAAEHTSALLIEGGVAGYSASQLSSLVGMTLSGSGCFYRASARSQSGIRHCSMPLWLSQRDSSLRGLLDEGT